MKSSGEIDVPFSHRDQPCWEFERKAIWIGSIFWNYKTHVSCARDAILGMRTIISLAPKEKKSLFHARDSIAREEDPVWIP